MRKREIKRKANKSRRLMRALAATLTVILSVAALGVLGTTAVLAAGSVVTAGEMTAIKSDFASYLVKDTVRVSDNYVGDMQYTVYYNPAKGGSTVQTGYKSKNPVVIYAVNTAMERVGRDSNKTIIQSMLDRGYVVVVLDYLSSEKAVSPALDYSAQHFRTSIANGTYMPNGTNGFPSITVDTDIIDKYPENFLVPSGCNLIYSDVFWEIDKHGADGTLDKIVESWNTDFMGKKADKGVKWATGNSTSTRKKTKTAADGTTVKWYTDVTCETESSTGLYTKVKWTVAEKIEDCVNPDGSAIDLNMYIHTVYPTRPSSEVPVIALANSSNYPTTMKTSADPRAHFCGFSFRGYAVTVFDYLWHPMAQNCSFGYYDGNRNGEPEEQLPTVTTDHMNYSIHLFNDKLVNTAALRYMRYLSLSETSIYNFDIDNIGVVGNSKGGWFTFLGEAVLQTELADKTKYSTTAALEEAIDERLASFVPKRYFAGHHGETRYQNGKTSKTTVNGVTIDGGEKQPWLTYDGKEIISGCQLVYAANGSQEEDLSDGHAPTFVALHIFDTYNAAYGSANLFANLCRNHDIPSMIFEVPLGHMLTYGEDMNYGVDTYLAFFDFCEYHLRDGAVKVVYVSPLDGDSDISTDGSITVKLSGPCDLENIKKITVTSSRGIAVSGSWSAEFGNTEWTFTPNEILKGGEGYTVTVPASLKGDNGKEMGERYVSHFTTSATSVYEPIRVQDNHASFTVPSLPSAGAGYTLKFYVSNDAANVAKIYATDTLYSDSGELVGSVNLRGAGHYSIDVSEYLSGKAGERVYFYVAEDKTAGEFIRYTADFSKVLNGNNVGKYAGGGIEDGKLKLYVKDNTGRYTGGGGVDVFYENNTSVLSNSSLINNGAKITEADLGRRYTVSFRVYDEVSRVLQVKLNSCSSSTNKTIDYNHVVQNVYTKAGEWCEISFVYTVYEADYGTIGNRAKTFNICASPTGESEKPFYIDDLKVTETVTDITVGAMAIEISSDTLHPYLANGTAAFSITSSNKAQKSFPSLKAALNAYQTGDVIKLMKNYTVGAAEAVNLADGADVSAYTIDLGGYTLDSSAAAPFLIKTQSNSPTTLSLNVKNGKIILKDGSLISFSGGVAKDGLSYTVKLEDVELELAKRAKLTELIADVKGAGDTKLNLAVALQNCRINAPEENFAGGYLTIFPVAIGDDGKTVANPNFDISYEITGGEISLSKVKTVRLTTPYEPNDSTKPEEVPIYPPVVFKKANGTYTKITLPKSVRVSPPDVPNKFIWYQPLVALYELDDTTVEPCSYVIYKSEGGIATHSPIPKTVADDVKTYPFIVFNELGGYIGGYSKLLTSSGAMNSAKGYLSANVYDATKKSYGANAKSAYITMRRDYELASGETYDNFAQIQNDVTVNLANYTLSTGNEAQLFSYEAKMWSGSGDGDSKVFPTTIRIKDGNVLVKGASLLKLTAWEYDANYTVAGKVSSLVFENVDFKTEKSTTSLIVTADKTPTAKTSFEIDFNGCSFDLRASSSTVKLFDASHPLWSISYRVRGGEILASSASKLSFASIDTSANEKNSLSVGSGVYGESLTAIFSDSSSHDTTTKYSLLSGGSSAFVKNALGEYVLCSHSYQYACSTKCSLCGAEKTGTAQHSYTKLNWDEGGHWYECECGEKQESSSEPHKGGTSTCKNKAICEVCDEPYGELAAHTFGDWIVDDDGHNRKCKKCGEFEGKATHTYGELTVTKEATENEEGEGTAECVCGHTKTEVIPKLEPKDGAPIGLIIGLSAGGVALAGGATAAGIVIAKKKKKK